VSASENFFRASSAREYAQLPCSLQIDRSDQTEESDWIQKITCRMAFGEDSASDGWYERGRQANAPAGKLVGAGGGGFLMFFTLTAAAPICFLIMELPVRI
jgi:galactokinase/mevalonate kinase-like predicted kinase